MKNKDLFLCKTCLNTSTRPRIIFDNDGRCNACIWSLQKKEIDWKIRLNHLKKFIKKNENKKSNYDLIVPVSGGKDGSYVTYYCKEKLKLKVLCVTVNPPLRSSLGYKNLENFKKNNIDLIEINLPKDAHRKLNHFGFVNSGRPLYGWLIAIFTAIINIADNFKINLIMYGEDGEAEYGGVSKLKNKPFFDLNFTKKIYLSNDYAKALKILKKNERHWWSVPNSKNIHMSHWSYFENWDSYRNFVISKKYMGYEENIKKNVGTYTNFGQNDTSLYDLHCYLMYLKFGFGRATQDIGIDIRRGAMTREQGIELVKIYDNEFPHYALDEYLEYFKMSKKVFFNIIDKHVNKKLFKKIKGKWAPKFLIQ
jgi:N-acetyl sugar amidotransferase